MNLRFRKHPESDSKEPVYRAVIRSEYQQITVRKLTVVATISKVPGVGSAQNPHWAITDTHPWIRSDAGTFSSLGAAKAYVEAELFEALASMGRNR